MEWRRDTYRITDVVDQVNLDVVYDLLSQSYWAGDRSIEVIARAVQNSLCFSLFHEDQQVGFARVVTDRAVFAWIADVIIKPDYRGLGLGKWLMACVTAHPDLQGTLQLLRTLDAHGLYERYGFERSEFLQRRSPRSRGSNMDAATLARFITEKGIGAEIVYLAAETPTVEAAAAAVGVKADSIGKSLLFLADGDPLLVIASGKTRVEYKRLARHLGINRKRLKLAKPDQVLEITGYPVGTVPPFGHKEPLSTLIEVRVLDQDEIYAGGGAINALLRLTTAELKRVTGAETITLQGDSDSN